MANALEWTTNGSMPRWLITDTLAGAVKGKGTGRINFSFNSADLSEGNYSAEFRISSNDPVKPYEIIEDGEKTGVVELPVEWIRDDAPYWAMDRFTGLRPYTPPSGVLEVFKREFDGAYKENGLFLLTMHPHFIGHRSRIQVLEELLEHITSHSEIWFATHADVAKYCINGNSEDK